MCTRYNVDAMKPTGWTANAAKLSPEPGAYLLLLRLDGSTPLPPHFGGRLPAGVYGYVGSARGPGGVAARCRRHLRARKPRHWHVDWLSTHAAARLVAPFYRARECDVLDALVSCGANLPVAGFGSTDCRCCTSHLAAIEITWSVPEYARLLERIRRRGVA